MRESPGAAATPNIPEILIAIDCVRLDSDLVGFREVRVRPSDFDVSLLPVGLIDVEWPIAVALKGADMIFVPPHDSGSTGALSLRQRQQYSNFVSVIATGGGMFG
jgi:hypothetical protein